MKFFKIAYPRIEHKWMEETDKYSFNPEKKFHWLQKLCLKILNKLGCNSLYTINEISTVTYETYKVTDFIMHQVNLVKMECKDVDQIIIGPEDWREILIHDNLTNLYPINMSFECLGKRQTYMGIKITVLPWCKEPLVIPKE